MNTIKRLRRKIPNIVRWLPVHWRDEDWDYAYLYIIMHTKIKHTRLSHEEVHNGEGWEIVVAQLKTVEDCLDRLLKGNYLEKEFDAHFEKYPTGECIGLPSGARQWPPMSEEASAEFRKLADEEERLISLDLKTVAYEFATHSRNCWD